MNIIMGLCGDGSRFKNVGFSLPKFLMIYNGAPMIYHAVETIKIPGKIHFVVREDQLLENKHLEKLLLGLGDEIIISKGRTRGAAESLLLAKNYIKDLNAPMLSANCDQYLSWNPFNLTDQMQQEPDVNLIADDHKENGEYYVAPVYNYSIQRGLKVKKYAIDNKEFWPVGTPDDFMYFNGNTTFFD